MSQPVKLNPKLNINSLFNLEFYKKKQDWKFRSDQTKQEKQSLNETYYVYKDDERGSQLNNAFLNVLPDDVENSHLNNPKNGDNSKHNDNSLYKNINLHQIISKNLETNNNNFTSLNPNACFQYPENSQVIDEENMQQQISAKHAWTKSQQISNRANEQISNHQNNCATNLRQIQRNINSICIPINQHPLPNVCEDSYSKNKQTQDINYSKSGNNQYKYINELQVDSENNNGLKPHFKNPLNINSGKQLQYYKGFIGSSNDNNNNEIQTQLKSVESYEAPTELWPVKSQVWENADINKYEHDIQQNQDEVDGNIDHQEFNDEWPMDEDVAWAPQTWAYEKTNKSDGDGDSSLVSVVDFFQGAHCVPHSSEIDLRDAATFSDSKSEGLSNLSMLQIEDKLSYHANILQRLLEEAVCRSSSGGNSTLQSISRATNLLDYYEHFDEYPTRDIGLNVPSVSGQTPIKRQNTFSLSKDVYIAGSFRDVEAFDKDFETLRGRGRGRLRNVDRVIGIGMGRPFRL